MEVNKLYENRHGQYRVLTIDRQVVTATYIDGPLTNNRMNGSVELLTRIHENIQIERRPKVEVKIGECDNASIVALSELLLVEGARIRVHCHPNSFAKFASDYFDMTNVRVEEDAPHVDCRTHYYECYTYQVVCSNRVEIPKGIKFTVRPHHEQQVTSKRLGAALIRSGFYLGPNKGSRK